MKNTKQKIALLSLAVLMVVAIVGGLIKPYIQNKDKGISSDSDGRLNIPNFQYTDRRGETVDFDSLRGKPIVINFWGTWCGWCVEEMADFNQLVKDYGDDVNFLFLNVANSKSETTQDVLDFLRENGYDAITTHFDSMGEGIYMFGINSFPTTIYADSEGNLYDAAIGLTDYDSAKKVIESMLEE